MGGRAGGKRKHGASDYRKSEWPSGLYRRANGRYFWRRMVDGDRRTKFLRTKNLNHAINRSMELNAEVDDKGKKIGEVVSKRTKPFIEAAEDYIVARQVEPPTAKRYRQHIQNVVSVGKVITGAPVLLVADLDDKFITTYIAERLKDPSSASTHKNTPKSKQAGPKTISNEHNLIRSVLKHSVTQGWLPAMPVMTAKVKGVARRGQASSVARPLDEPEMKMIFRAAKQYDKKHIGKCPHPTYFHDIIRTFIYSGLRHGELKMLEWSDVNLKTDLLSVRKKRVRSTRRLHFSREGRALFAPMLTGKNANSRALPDDDRVLTRAGDYLHFKMRPILTTLRVKDFDLNESVVTIKEEFVWKPKASEGDVVIHPKLKALLGRLRSKSTSNFVFPELDGGYWRMRFERHLQRIAVLAGIPDFHRPHDLRHTTGAMLRRKGVALETIKEILRHKDIQDTLIYARYEHAEGREAIKKIPW